MRRVPEWRAFYPSWRRAFLPALLLDLRDAHRFCEARGWRTDRFRRFQAAKLARLDLLPASVALANAFVVDVGANSGAWTAAVLTAEPLARVLAVEPNEEARAELRRVFEHDPRVRIDPRAASAAPGIVSFHLTGHTANASLLRPRSRMQELYGGTTEWAVKRVVQVEATTVDELTRGDPVALLKIDVQGAERTVIAGARETLRRTAAVLLEILFVSHYEEDSDFADLNRTMREHDFTLVGLGKPFATGRHPALWVDACYIQSSLLTTG
jgi:FkbM family methyltransferase